MKYVVCQTLEEAQILVDRINQELGYPRIHELGVDSFIEKTGNAYQRFSQPGALRTETEVVLETSTTDQIVVILDESNKQEIEALKDETIIEGTIEIKEPVKIGEPVIEEPIDEDPEIPVDSGDSKLP